MITIEYIESTTKAITSPRKSVELAKSGQLYVPTVRRVVKELSDTDMERLIMTYLVRLNVVLNLARPMNDVMIKTTAGLAVQQPSILPNIRVFSSESAVRIRGPK